MGDAKEEASQKSCWDNEMASAISNRDCANAEVEADTANLSKLNAEHNDLMKDIAKNENVRPEHEVVGRGRGPSLG